MLASGLGEGLGLLSQNGVECSQNKAVWVSIAIALSRTREAFIEQYGTIRGATMPMRPILSFP